MMKIRMKIKNGSYRYDLGVDMDTNIVKKKCYFYILSNT